MAKQVKTLENMSKHLTKDERTARENAEEAVRPKRATVKLHPPAYIREDKRAGKYWRAVLKRVKDVDLLDDLDSDTLALYCSMLSRRDALDEVYREVLTGLQGSSTAEQRLELMETLDGVIAKLQAHEKTVLQYAEHLGLTPSGRARLARKRADTTMEADPNADLYGD